MGVSSKFFIEQEIESENNDLSIINKASYLGWDTRCDNITDDV